MAAFIVAQACGTHAAHELTTEMGFPCTWCIAMRPRRIFYLAAGDVKAGTSASRRETKRITPR
jgi:hypothetical protein